MPRKLTVSLIGMGGELATADLPIDPAAECINLQDDTGRRWMLRAGDTLVVRNFPTQNPRKLRPVT